MEVEPGVLVVASTIISFVIGWLIGSNYTTEEKTSKFKIVVRRK
jgi:hypothetical protein